MRACFAAPPLLLAAIGFAQESRPDSRGERGGPHAALVCDVQVPAAELRVLVEHSPSGTCMHIRCSRYVDAATVLTTFPPTPYFSWWNASDQCDFKLPGRNAALGLRCERPVS